MPVSMVVEKFKIQDEDNAKEEETKQRAILPGKFCVASQENRFFKCLVRLHKLLRLSVCSCKSLGLVLQHFRPTVNGTPSLTLLYMTEENNAPPPPQQLFGVSVNELQPAKDTETNTKCQQLATDPVEQPIFVTPATVQIPIESSDKVNSKPLMPDRKIGGKTHGSKLTSILQRLSDRQDRY